MPTLYDGQKTFLSGQHGGKEPCLLNASQYSRAINVDIRNGNLKPRESYHNRVISFETKRSREIFELGKFQAASFYDSNVGDYIVACVSGNIYFIDIASFYAVRLSDDNTRLSQYADTVEICQFDKFLVLQDGMNAPIAFNGLNRIVLDRKSLDMGTGRYMAYGQGRGFYVDVATRGIYASKIYAQGLQIPENLLNFDIDPQYLVPYDIGRITGIKFLPVLDNSTGIGELIVTGTHGIYAFNVLTPRDQWASTVIGRKVASNVNVSGQRSIIDVNGDLYFRRSEGIGSLASVRSDFQSPLNLPMSYEVENWLDQDNQNLLHYIDCSYFNNKLRMTINPQYSWSRGLDGLPVCDVICKGIVTLDLSPASGLQERAPASYTGIETGVNPVSLVDVVDDGKKRAFIFSRDADSTTRIYEIMPHEHWDIGAYELSDGTNDREIEWVVETKAYDFGQPFDGKKLGADESPFIDISDVRGSVELVVLYRTDNYQIWKKWGKKKINAKMCRWAGKDDESRCYINPLPQSVYRIPLPYPEEECDELTGRLLTNFSSLQLRIEVKGHCRIDRLKLASMWVGMDDTSMEVSGSCEDSEEITSLLSGCLTDSYSYKISDPNIEDWQRTIQ